MKANTIKRVFVKAFIFARKYAPVALAGLSAVGIVATTVSAIKTAEEATKEEQTDEEKTVVEKTVAIVKKYHKPIIFGTVSIGMIGLSTYMFMSRQKHLSLVNEQMNELLHRYTQAATATAGVEGTKLLNKLQENTPLPEQESNPDDDGKVLFWDPAFQRYFRTEEVSFLNAAYQTSCNFSMTGGETYADFCYKMNVDVPRDQHGNPMYGWGWYADDDWVNDWCEMSGYIGIGYSGPYKIDDDVEYYLVTYDQAPKYYEELDVPWRA